MVSGQYAATVSKKKLEHIRICTRARVKVLEQDSGGNITTAKYNNLGGYPAQSLNHILPRPTPQAMATDSGKRVELPGAT